MDNTKRALGFVKNKETAIAKEVFSISDNIAEVPDLLKQVVESVNSLRDKKSMEVSFEPEKVAEILKKDEEFKSELKAKDGPTAEEVAQELSSMQSFLNKVEGKPGESVTPYEVVEELKLDKDFIESVKGDPGKPGIPGDPGADSNPEDVAALLKSDITFVEELRGKDGSPDSPFDIRRKLEMLIGDDRLSASHIKGFEEFTEDIKAQVKSQNGPAGTFLGGNVRYFKDLSDVNFSGITNGQVPVWDSTTHKWLPGTGAGGGTWGSITGTLSDQTDLQAAFDNKVTKNSSITGATKTKITYDSKGLVTSGTDATTADIADSSNRRYVTDAQLTVIGNTSGTNTGDQTSIVGITGTKAQFDTAVTDGNFLYVGDVTQYTDELAQDAVGGILVDSSEIDFTYSDATPSITASIVAGSIDETKLDTSVNASLDLADSAVQPATLSGYFNKSTDDTDDITVGTTNKFATAAEKTKLGHITITQAVDLDALESAVAALDQATILKGTWDASAGTFPGSGSAQAGWSYIVSVAGTVDGTAFSINDRIIAITDNASTTTFASNWFKADYTDQVLSVFGRTGAVTATSGDYNTSQVTENTNLYFTDERAQDAVGGMVDSTIVYTDGTPLLSRAALTGAITASAGSNTTALGSFTKAQLDSAVSDGNVLYVGDVTSNATHTGEVTGATTLTVDKTAITNRTEVTAAVGDHVMIADASDSSNLKKVTVQTIVDLASGSGISESLAIAYAVSL